MMPPTVRKTLKAVPIAMSTLLGVAALGLWIRSCWIHDSLEWVSHYRVRFISSVGGRVLVQVNHGASASREFEPFDYDAYVLRPRDRMSMGRPWRFGGFWVENLSFPPTASHPAAVPYTDIVFPLYAIVLASSILPIAAAYKAIRRQRRGPGVCRTCGYDLRATPNRCPECGAESVAVETGRASA